MLLIRRRLQIQPKGQPSVDRSIVFCVGELTEGERKKLRGVVVQARDKLDAAAMFRDLHRLAKEAADEGTIAQFLDALDQRHRTAADSGPTFSGFVDEWKATCVVGAVRESTEESDLSILKLHLLPYFGKLHLRDIDARQVDRYKAAKRAQKHQYGTGYSAHTINNHLSVLHRICEKAVEYGHLDKNPVSKKAWLKRDTVPEDSENWWTPAEEARAVECLMTRWREREPLAFLALLTQVIVGVRFGELRALEKRDLDLQAPGLRISRAMARKKTNTPKNKKGRFHVIPRGLADELQRWMLRTEGQLLFPSEHGRPLPNNTLNRWYVRLCTEAGVRRISSHGARHTAGSSYAVMGASQKMIGGLLGHADTASTERYTHMHATAAAPVVEARWATLINGGGGK